MSPRTPFRVLCFGDSLTDGFPVGHPYAEKLKEKLEAAFPNLDVQYEVDGLPGDLVTRGEFHQRMIQSWKNRRAKPFEWTIVLGGTNDIGWGINTDEIIEALHKTWELPLQRGSKVLALTIPEAKASRAVTNEKRDAVNQAIKNYKKTNFFAFDLHGAVPYHSMSVTDREKYWDLDGLHMTEHGYDLMGEKIAESLITIMRVEEATSTDISSVIATARQRRAIEELIFEEERGDPKLLSQGYIIVRKRDLD